MLPAPLSITAHMLRARWRWHMLHGSALSRFQEHRAQRITAFTALHAPFYRRHWAGHNHRHWRDLPLVDKQLMMANFDEFNTRGFRRDAALAIALGAEQNRNFRPLLHGHTVGLSSGTSGHRGLFLISPTEQAAWAGTILARTLHQFQGRLRVAFFLRSNSNLYEQVGGMLLQFRYIDLMLPLPQAVAILNQMQPHIVVGPPSLLGMLADALDSGVLSIRPQRLISVAEVLDPEDRSRLETTFDVPVHQIYQCTEGLLAVSCRAGSLHIQEDIIALQTEPAPAAEATDPDRVTPIITDLWRRTQPIIRYRLGDVLQVDHRRCTCGSDWRVISRIEGRSDDLCWFEGHDGTRRVFFPDTIRRMLLLASSDILDYQAVQERDSCLRVHLSIRPGAQFHDVARCVQQSIATTIAAYACRPATITIEPTLLPIPVGAKRRRVMRLPPQAE